MIMKKVLFSLLLIFLCANGVAKETQEERFQACYNRYKEVPTAYMEHILNKPRSVNIPVEADILVKKVRSVILGETASVDITDQQIMEYLIVTCMKAQRA